MPKLTTILRSLSHGAADQGCIPTLDADGMIDASFLPVKPSEERGLPVGAYILPGELLTSSTFDAAFRRAVTEAFNRIVNNTNITWNVVVPTGRNWRLTSPVLFPGTYNNHVCPTPGVVGAGMESTEIVCAFHNTDPESGVFVCGSDDSYAQYQRFEGFTLQTDNGARVGNGIMIKTSLRMLIRDVYVRGFSEVQHWKSGWGIKFAQPVDNSFVHQHPHLDNVGVQLCQGGLHLSHVAQLSSNNLWINQNIWQDISYENCAGTISGGATFQCADAVPGPSSIGWFNGTLHPAITTGMNITLGLVSGASATLAAATFAGNVGTCIVSGLSGMTEADTNRWLELTKSGEAASGITRKISGVYQISRWIDATSVEILKGTDHGIETGLAWQVRGNHGGSAIQIEGFPYHEGVKRCLVFHGPDENTSSILSVRNVLDFNLTAVVIADRLNRLEFGSWPSNGNGAALYVRRCGTVVTDVDITRIDTDEFTRCNLTARKTSTQIDTRTTSFFFVPDRPHGALVDVLGDHCNAAFLMDFRRKDKLTLSGADIQGGTELANSIALTPQNSGKYPTRTADSRLGHCMQILGAASGANVGSLVATIPANKLPSRPFKGTMVLIGRFSSDPSANSGIAIGSDVTRWWHLTMNNGGQSFAAMYPPGGLGGSPIFGQAWPANTDPFCIVLGGQIGYFSDQETFGQIYNNVDLSQDLNTGSSGYPIFPGGQNLNVRIGQPLLNNCSSDYISLVAFLPDAVSVEQLRRIKSAARAEFLELNN